LLAAVEQVEHSGSVLAAAGTGARNHVDGVHGDADLEIVDDEMAGDAAAGVVDRRNASRDGSLDCDGVSVPASVTLRRRRPLTGGGIGADDGLGHQQASPVTPAGGRINAPLTLLRTPSPSLDDWDIDGRDLDVEMEAEQLPGGASLTHTRSSAGGDVDPDIAAMISPPGTQRGGVPAGPPRWSTGTAGTADPRDGAGEDGSINTLVNASVAAAAAVAATSASTATLHSYATVDARSRALASGGTYNGDGSGTARPPAASLALTTPAAAPAVMDTASAVGEPLGRPLSVREALRLQQDKLLPPAFQLQVSGSVIAPTVTATCPV